jgi:hypothetical protein
VSATDVPPPPPGCVWGPALLDGDPPAWCAITDKGPRMYRDDAWGRAPPLDAGPIYHAAFEAGARSGGVGVGVASGWFGDLVKADVLPLSLPDVASIVADVFHRRHSLAAPRMTEALRQIADLVAVVAPDPEHDAAALRGAGLKTLDESYSFRKLGKEPEPLLDRIVDRMDRVITGATAEAHEAAFYPGCDVDPGTERANLALDALCRMWLAERAKKLGKE